MHRRRQALYHASLPVSGRGSSFWRWTAATMISQSLAAAVSGAEPVDPAQLVPRLATLRDAELRLSQTARYGLRQRREHSGAGRACDLCSLVRIRGGA